MCAISRGFPPLMRIPFCAATPVPTITAVGVARPKEQGHAMLSTVIEVWNANRSISSAFVTSLFWFCKRGGKKQQQRDACLLIVEDNTHAQSYSFQKKPQKNEKTKNTHLPRNLQDRKTIYYCYCNGRETSILWIVYGSILWLSCCSSTHMLQDFLLDTTSRITPYINTDSAFRLLDDCVASWPSLHNLPKENPTSRCMDCHSCRA